MDIRSRLNNLAARKAVRDCIEQDVVAGKYDDVVAGAREHFVREAPKPAYPPTEALHHGGDILTGSRGRTHYWRYILEGGCRGGYWLPEQCLQNPVPHNTPALLAKGDAREPVDPTQVAFLDTETTGLMGSTGTLAFLVGVGWWEGCATGWRFVLEQYLIDDFCHEADLVERLAERLKGFTVLCTYNGRAFDVPLLRARAIMHRHPPRMYNHRQLDLLTSARRIWRGVLPSVSLKTVEREILAIDRGPDIDGAMIPELFFAASRTGSIDRLIPVLKHNAQDIATLAGLLPHIAAVAENPMGCGRLTRAGEYACVSRWMQAMGRIEEAEATARQAAALFAAGNDRLSEEAVLFRLGTLLKRRREWEEALGLWERLRKLPIHRAAPAWLETAKYHEHIARDFRTALGLVRACQAQYDMEMQLRTWRQNDNCRENKIHAELEKREARLLKKISAASGKSV